MNKLYVAIQNFTTRLWTVVGMLERFTGFYRFSYTHGSRIEGFTRFGSLKKDVTESEDLFPFFQNRLLNKSRPEYSSFLNWLALENGDDPFEILALTEGKRATDQIEVFAHPSPVNGRFVTKFFVHGAGYTAQTMADGFKISDDIYLMMDVQNHIDSDAIALRSNNPKCFLGYVPRYMTSDIKSLCSLISPKDINVRLIKENREAPVSFRYLCQIEAPWPPQFSPCSTEEFVPLTS